MNRRSLLMASTAAIATGGSGGVTAGSLERGSGDALSPAVVVSLAKPRLPFSADALAPKLSAESIRSHFAGFHVPSYQRLLNLEAGMRGASTLAEVIRQSAGQPAAQDLFLAAAQLFNHNLYWNSLSALPARIVPALVEGCAKRDFGGMGALQDALLTAALDHTGPGWLWLLADERGRLSVRTLDDLTSPLTMGLRPLLAVDLWEHAYYLDYRHRRSAYLASMLDVLNWDFAAEMLLSSASGTSRA